ncbi:Holliday junction branch migration protein RuvA [bacterium]|nr:Holliday junction branch migration protein RuvA [bacterium]
MIYTMIGRLEGVIVFRGERYIILDVTGVGYIVYVSSDTLRMLPKTEGRSALFTHLAVRENALELYGFPTRNELALFEMLIGVSGIGPKSALGVMNQAAPDTLRRAIAAGDTTYLTKVSGIGRKTAEKIVLELKDKLGGSNLATGGGGMLKEETDALAALQSLGYSAQEARDALKQVPPEHKTVSDRVKAALKTLGS